MKSLHFKGPGVTASITLFTVLAVLSAITYGSYFFAPDYVNAGLEIVGASPLKPSSSAASAAITEAENSTLVTVSKVDIVSIAPDTSAFGRVVVTSTVEATFSENLSDIKQKLAANGNTSYATSLKERFGDFSKGETKTLTIKNVLVPSQGGRWTAYSPELIG